MEKLMGERIAELRRKKGLTQIQLAEKLNISDKAVSKWESNKSDPSLEMLVALSNFFECSIDYIVKGEEEKKSQPKIFFKRYGCFPLVEYFKSLGEIDPKISDEDFVKLFNFHPVRIDNECLYLLAEGGDDKQQTVSNYSVNLLLENISKNYKKVQKIKFVTDKIYDSLFKDSVKLTIQKGVVSVSSLQRTFGIGFVRAYRIVEEMEKNDFISAPNEVGEREIYISAEKFKELFDDEV